MNRRTKQNLTLTATIIYLAFACMYVMGRYTNCANLYRQAYAKVTRSADNIIAKKDTFQSRPRVVNNRQIVLFAVCAVLICLCFACGRALTTDNLFFLPPALHSPISRVIFLRLLRI